MAQRKSGFERQPLERYETREPWIVAALGEHLPLKGLSVWEPAAGTGKLAGLLEAAGATVWSSDIEPAGTQRSRLEGVDFLDATWCPEVDMICTNPPFGGQGRLAVGFIEAGLRWLRAPRGPRLLALLLSVDFDSASTRVALFRDCEEFSAKIVLLRRIRWFDGPSGPSTNHAWFVFRRAELGSQIPRLLYGPTATNTETAVELDSL